MAILESVQDAICMTKSISIQLALDFEVLDSFKEEVAQLVSFDGVIANWQLLMEIHGFFRADPESITIF
jgi:hypothetical protein